MLRLMMAWESLLSESQTSNLTLAQNELSAFTLIFLIFFYDLALCIFKLAYVAARKIKKMIKHERLL
jgi:hypothetical protein